MGHGRGRSAVEVFIVGAGVHGSSCSGGFAGHGDFAFGVAGTAAIDTGVACGSEVSAADEAFLL